MATRFIESVSGVDARNNLIPTTPGKAGICFREDTVQVDVRGPAGTAIALPTALTSLQTARRRSTIAEVNAAVTLLPAIPGFKYRIVDLTMIAVGGAAGATTTVDILGTQATASVKLLAVAIAALTQSALVRAGAANATILADGASFAVCDTNTAITLSKTGAALTTATHIDTQVSYVLEAA